MGALIADEVGYGRLMIFAFLMHLLSAALQLGTGEIYATFGREATYWSLYIAMFMFAIGNGTCEVVVNPLVATLYPNEKTHYLNILHAGWPGGLVAGGLVSYFMNGGTIGDFQPFPNKVPWIIQMSMFLVPVFVYGIMMLGQHFPKSEASQAGISYGTMLLEFLSPILLLLLLIHALVGYVELGTDSWISKITGSIMEDPRKGLLLFVYTSGLMFALRFFAGPIVHAISPLGLLCISGIFGAVGLTLLSSAVGIMMCVIAATVYAIGKTFLWPTMLAVVSDRFPKGGAITIGAVGGVGMLSAGILGGPGIGFKQDYFATTELKQKAPSTYERYASPNENTFLGVFKVKGLDGAKVGVLEDDGQDLSRAVELATKVGTKDKAVEEQAKLATWWASAKEYAAADKEPITEASLYGGRMALKWTAAVPAAMAVLYLILLAYFKMIGGYKRVEIPTDSTH
ncbi:MAG TPA: MFS transporter [Gemmataceae bacterium]|nr:MFS transporter [Gemmataceae bacterium]